MPKGETSRPLNATQKRAARTLLMLNREMKNKSDANRLEIMSGTRYVKAAAILGGVHKSEYTRKTMKELGRKEGASKATKGLRTAVKDSSYRLTTGMLKDINKKK